VRLKAIVIRASLGNLDIFIISQSLDEDTLYQQNKSHKKNDPVLFLIQNNLLYEFL